MRFVRLAIVLLGAGAVGLAACSLVTDLSGLAGNGQDASAGDGATDGLANPFFSLAATSPVSVEPGGSAKVTVTLTRAPGFTDVVAVSVNGLPASVNATSLTIPSGQAAGTFDIAAGSAAAAGSFPLTVVGVAGGRSAQAGMTLLVGGVLARFTSGSTSFVVPDAVTTLRIKAWGAGGAGGSGPYAFGSSGGGGFAQSEVSVTGGESLTVEVGAGGETADASSGGGGGGYSAVLRGSTVLVLAGGGGGGGGGAGGGAPGVPGGGGGGASGESAMSDGGGGGTPSAGGAGGLGKGTTSGAAGAALQGGGGGDGKSSTTGGGGKGGAPGGGSGGAGGTSVCGGGGGGGGWFGGGGGQAGNAGANPSLASGGGGGSAWATGANVMLVAGANPWPGNYKDVDWQDAGRGGLGATVGTAGGAGLIVLILP